MRAVWTSPAAQTYQGANNRLYVRGQNTVKGALSVAQQQLLIDHQQEDAVDGGAASTTQFHFLLAAQPNDNLANITTLIYAFDSNQGAAGTANWVMPRRVRRNLR